MLETASRAEVAIFLLLAAFIAVGYLAVWAPIA